MIRQRARMNQFERTDVPNFIGTVTPRFLPFVSLSIGLSLYPSYLSSSFGFGLPLPRRHACLKMINYSFFFPRTHTHTSS